MIDQILAHFSSFHAPETNFPYATALPRINPGYTPRLAQGSIHITPLGFCTYAALACNGVNKLRSSLFKETTEGRDSAVE